jgi:hypothetical protein
VITGTSTLSVELGTVLSGKNTGSCGRVGVCAPFYIATAPLEQILTSDPVLRVARQPAQQRVPTAHRPPLTFGMGARA